MNVSEAIVKQLSSVGIKHAFGIPAHSIVDITDAMIRTGAINFITVRHEQVAASMADGYARVSGLPAVCMSGAGPGAANMLLGIATAYRSSVPLLAITANVDLPKSGRRAFNEWDQMAIYSHITKKSFQIRDPETAVSITRRALEAMVTDRPGPVHLDLPENVAYTEITHPSKVTSITFEISRRPASEEKMKEVLRLLEGAQKPVIIAGGGAMWSGASSNLVRTVELLSAPFAVSMTARGIIAEDHPLCFGPPGRWGFPACNEIIQSSDLIIGLGFTFGESATDGWTLLPKGVKIIQVDIDPSEIGRQYDVDLGVSADVDTFLLQLNEILMSDRYQPNGLRKWPKAMLMELQESLKKQRATFLSPPAGSPIDPRIIVREVMSNSDMDAIITVGAGKHSLFAGRMIVQDSRRLLKAGEFGPMTFAFPAALGAKIAKPERQVICLIGDGDFMMTIQDLETAVRHNIAVVSVIFNDECYNAERLPRHDGREVGIEFKNPDFVKLAESFGALGSKVSSSEEFGPVLQSMLKAGVPAIIDTIIDKDAKV